jgi:UDP-N-acetylenolpyruvoylglucosamine reductase
MGSEQLRAQAEAMSLDQLERVITGLQHKVRHIQAGLGRIVIGGCFLALAGLSLLSALAGMGGSLCSVLMPGIIGALLVTSGITKDREARDWLRHAIQVYEQERQRRVENLAREVDKLPA